MYLFLIYIRVMSMKDKKKFTVQIELIPVKIFEIHKNNVYDDMFHAYL